MRKSGGQNFIDYLLDTATQTVVSYSEEVVLTCPGYFPNGQNLIESDWRVTPLEASHSGSMHPSISPSRTLNLGLN